MELISIVSSRIPLPFHYRVSEGREGELFWSYLETPRGKVERQLPVFVLPRTGGMGGQLVSGEEAEIVTGLHMPAAMDRLRELVHESR